MQEDDFKVICGQLIGYYRKSYYMKTKSHQYTQRGMVIKTLEQKHLIKQKSICSTTTLRQIENGMVKRNDNLYQLLSQKIGYSYLYSRKYLDTISVLIDKVYRSIEKMNRAEMLQLYRDIEQHELTNYLYYAENLKILSWLLAFYLYQQLPDEKVIFFYQQTKTLLPETTRRMALHLSLEHYRRVDYHPDKIYELIDFQLLQNWDYLSLYTLIPCYITAHRYMKASTLLEKLKNHHDFTSNPYKQFYYYNMSACILTNIDFEAADDALKTCLSLIEDTNHFADFQKAALYHNIGLRHLFKQHYHLAVDYLLRASKLNPQLIPAMLPYLYEACQKNASQDQSFHQVLISYQKTKMQPEGLFSHYYKYFLRRCKQLNRQTALDLENRIVKNIMPSLKASSQNVYYSSYLREFFLDELRILNHFTHSHDLTKKI